ncbi:hypothetical protein KI387_016301, partial [Taxus chinensis]
HRVNLVETLTDFDREHLFPVEEWVVQSLVEARRVVATLSARNVELMKFASDVHGTCVASSLSGCRIKKLDLPGLSAPMAMESEGVAHLRQQMGFSYNLLLRLACGGATAGGKKVEGSS